MVKNGVTPPSFRLSKVTRMNIKTRLGVCLILMGTFRTLYAEEQPLKPHNYQQEVRESLQELQSYLDKMFAFEELTPEQYKIETRRVRQLGLKLGVDLQKGGTLTKDERNRDFTTMDQIQREASRWAAADSANASYGQQLQNFGPRPR
jgi:hypothetical protein